MPVMSLILRGAFPATLVYPRVDTKMCGGSRCENACEAMSIDLVDGFEFFSSTLPCAGSPSADGDSELRARLAARTCECARLQYKVRALEERLEHTEAALAAAQDIRGADILSKMIFVS